MNTDARVVVSVELHASLEHLAGGAQGTEVRDRVEAHLADLLRGLGIPLAYRVALAAPRLEGGVGPPYGLQVNGEPCRVPVQWSDSDAASPRELARVIGWALCRNRKLLLTQALSERIRGVWATQGGSKAADLAPEDFHALLLQLIDRGSNIDRARPMTPLPVVKPCGFPWERGAEEMISASPDATAVGLVLSSACYAKLWAPGTVSIPRGDRATLRELLDYVTDKVFEDGGLLIAPPGVGTDHRLDALEFRTTLNDLRWPPIEGLTADEWLVDASPDELRGQGIAAVDALHPLADLPWQRVRGDDELLERCRKAGTTLGAAGFIAASLRATLREHGAHLLTTEVVSCLLGLLHDTDPMLVEATARRFDTTVLTWILRDLLRDGLSIRDLRNLLESVLCLEGSKASATALIESGTPLDVTFWADFARTGQKRQISHDRLTGGRLVVFLLAGELEARIAESDVEPLSEPEREGLLRLLLKAQQSRAAHPLLIVTKQEARRKLRRLIELELPKVAVISYPELDPDADIVPLARIGDVGALTNG